MLTGRFFSRNGTVWPALGLSVLLLAAGWAFQAGQAQAIESGPNRVKVYETFANAPKNPIVGQIYRNPEDNTDYIYNGRIWLPHDKRADDIDYDQVRRDLQKAKEGRK